MVSGRDQHSCNGLREEVVQPEGQQSAVVFLVQEEWVAAPQALVRLPVLVQVRGGVVAAWGRNEGVIVATEGQEDGRAVIREEVG